MISPEEKKKVIEDMICFANEKGMQIALNPSPFNEKLNVMIEVYRV